MNIYAIISTVLFLMVTNLLVMANESCEKKQEADLKNNVQKVVSRIPSSGPANDTIIDSKELFLTLRSANEQRDQIRDEIIKLQDKISELEGKVPETTKLLSSAEVTAILTSLSLPIKGAEMKAIIDSNNQLEIKIYNKLLGPEVVYSYTGTSSYFKAEAFVKENGDSSLVIKDRKYLPSFLLILTSDGRLRQLHLDNEKEPLTIVNY